MASGGTEWGAGGQGEGRGSGSGGLPLPAGGAEGGQDAQGLLEVQFR